MWLSKLPSEVLDRIVAHLTKGRPSDDGLSLARTKKELQHSVLNVVNVNVPAGRLGRIDEWGTLNPKRLSIEVTSTCRRDTEVYIQNPIAFENCRQLKEKIQLFKPQALSIPTEKTLLWSLARGNALDTVVQLNVVVTCGHEGIGELFSEIVLAARCLKKLVIIGRYNYLFTPSAGRAAGFVQNFARLACPQLEILHLTGNKRPPSRYCFQYLTCFVSCLTNLRELRISHRLTEEDMVNLKCVPNVRLSRGAATLRAANVLQERVTELEFHHCEPFNAYDLSILGCCTRLEVLNVGELREGAETSLSSLFKNTPRLRELRLIWTLEEEVQEDSETPYEQRKIAKAIPGQILAAVCSAKELSVLHLCNVSIEASELEKILHHAGVRLRDLCTSILYQGEDPTSRLLTIMNAISRNNHELRSLTFPAKETKELVHYQVQSFIMESLKDGNGGKLCAAISQLEQNARYLDCTEVRHVLNHMIQFVT